MTDEARPGPEHERLLRACACVTRSWSSRSRTCLRSDFRPARRPRRGTRWPPGRLRTSTARSICRRSCGARGHRRRRRAGRTHPARVRRGSAAHPAGRGRVRRGDGRRRAPLHRAAGEAEACPTMSSTPRSSTAAGGRSSGGPAAGGGRLGRVRVPVHARVRGGEGPVGAPRPSAGGYDAYAGLRAEFEAHLDAVEQRYLAGDLDERTLHLALSKEVRGFASGRLGVDASVLTLSEIEHMTGTQHLTRLIARYYRPSFAEYDVDPSLLRDEQGGTRTGKDSIDRARSVVRTW
ncbi:hypothetical protein NKG05_15325 [Oerskovia sp. M15]